VKTREPSMPCIPGARRRAVVSRILEGLGLAALTTVVVLSAIVTKEMQARGRLAALAAIDAPVAAVAAVPAAESAPLAADPLARPVEPVAPAAVEAGEVEAAAGEEGVIVAEFPAGMEESTEIRWFNGRPVRPARTMWMTVTAYSPDERSCGKWADGITASLHSVWTNGMQLVAADTRILPMGSLVSVPGYAGGEIVPVLDRGGAIKGHRLDVLYPTHEIARKWGVKRLKVTVWEYADGKGAENWRKIRDSKR